MNYDGQLTFKGKQRQANVGEQLRYRYLNESFINESFANGRYYFHSTQTDRTLQSALSFAYGFFPPEVGPKLNDELIFTDGYQPIALYNTPNSEDTLAFGYTVWFASIFFILP